MLFDAIKAQNLTATALSNQPGACTTTCAAYAVDSARVLPPVAEGARHVFVNGNLFNFGGYGA